MMTPIKLRVRDYRERKGWTGAELAEKAGVRAALISEIESGKRTNVQLSTLERIANALGVDAALLIEHKRAKAKPNKGE